MLNSCDEYKHLGLTVDDIENGEANEDDSDSDSETNMVRYYQRKRGDDGYLTKLIVEADADEALVWAVNGKRKRSTFTISGGSSRRFAALETV